MNLNEWQNKVKELTEARSAVEVMKDRKEKEAKKEIAGPSSMIGPSGKKIYKDMDWHVSRYEGQIYAGVVKKMYESNKPEDQNIREKIAASYTHRTNKTIKKALIEEFIQACYMWKKGQPARINAAMYLFKEAMKQLEIIV